MKRIINENQVGVLIKKGKFAKVLGAGKYRYSPLFLREEIQVFDIRPKYLVVMDTFLTRDAISVSVGLSVSYSLKQLLLYLKTVENEAAVVRTLLVDLLREQMLKETLDELLEKQSDIHKNVGEKYKAALEAYGLQLVQLSPANVSLPRNVKQSIEASLVARKKSQADLEEARGRTAVLRHYANAARQVSDQPELLKLLLGQKAKSLNFHFDSSPTPAEKQAKPKST